MLVFFFFGPNCCGATPQKNSDGDGKTNIDKRSMCACIVQIFFF